MISEAAYGAPGGRRTAAMPAASNVVSNTAASAARKPVLPACDPPCAHSISQAARPSAPAISSSPSLASANGESAGGR
jgi:hypothetical protein